MRALPNGLGHHGHVNKGGYDEPAWYYSLDERVRLALEHNFAVPLLAVDRITIRSSPH